MNRNSNPYSDFGNQNLLNEQDQALLATIDNIKQAHEKRVEENTRRDKIINAIILEQDIQEHEQWLRDVGGRRVFTEELSPGTLTILSRHQVTRSVSVRRADDEKSVS